MKKFVTMMVVALVAVSASAASIDWTVSLGRTGKFVDSTGANMNGTIYLVLADTTFNATTAEEFDAQLTAATLGTAAVSASKLTSTANATATSDALTAGTSYDFAIVVYDAANSMYYTSASNSGYAYESGVDDATSIKFTSAQAGTDGSATWTPTYTAVPEPASAMLALAGVAMLIRRRK